MLNVAYVVLALTVASCGFPGKKSDDEQPVATSPGTQGPQNSTSTPAPTPTPTPAPVPAKNMGPVSTTYTNSPGQYNLIKLTAADRANHPWMNYIGRLRYVKEDDVGILTKNCTAELVATNKILTALHCVEGRENELNRFTFELSFVNGNSMGKSKITSVAAKGSRIYPDVLANDWVILKIDRDLGKDGFLEISDATWQSVLQENRTVVTGGYPMSMDNGDSYFKIPDCKLLDVSQFKDKTILDSKAAFHNCGAAVSSNNLGGFSGGAMLANFGTDTESNWKIIGTFVGAYRYDTKGGSDFDAVINVMTPAATFKNSL